MYKHISSRTSVSGPRALWCTVLGLLLVGAAPLVGAQDAAPAAAPAPSTATTPAPAPAGLDELVGRVALYPDDLLSIVLPASTFPLQVVEADRWLRENKDNKEAKPKDAWDESVKALINYPDVVTMMSNDLDWTSAMGEAVAADQTAVMDAVQSFRRKAQGAGNLKTDDKQVVEVDEDVVKIVQADPKVIYVPQYEPQVVVVQQTTPYYPVYYPTPYPCYYYPYPPGYSFAAGVFWGATLAYAFDWHGGGIHNDIDININRNVNINNTNINNRATNIDRSRSQQMKTEGRGSWQSKQSPSNIRQGRAPTASARPAGGAGGAQAANRVGGASQGQRLPASAGNTAASRQAGGATAANRSQPSAAASGNRYNNTSRSASTARTAPPSSDAFSGMSSGRSVNAQSARGAMSRGAGGFGGAGGFSGGGGMRRR